MISQDDIIYFIVTDRFAGPEINSNKDKSIYEYHGGSFSGIIEKIPYLKELGITALWITPVYLSIGKIDSGSEGYHGYWAMDFEKIDPHLYEQNPEYESGSKKYLKDLCDKLHANNIKLILDMVVNHTGYHNDVYKKYEYTKMEDGWFNRGGSGEVKGELAGLPDLDHDNPDVRDYFIQNILSWIEECGIDAVRMDTVKHVEKAFWYFFKSYIKGKYRNISLIGEVLDEHNVDKISKYQTMHDFDTLFDFPLCTKIKNTFVHGAGMTEIARPRLSSNENPGILDLDTEYYANANRLVTLLDNHDLKCRIKTEILDKWGHWDRMRANKILKLCLSFLFTTRGIPQIYYGTEIGMEGGTDPYNRRDMRWEIFDKKYKADARDTEYHDASEIFNHVKRLIKIRKENPCIAFGYLFTIYSDYYVYAYLREFNSNIILVVINNGLEAMKYPLEISINQNSNIPSRVKKLISNSDMVNLLDTDDSFKVKEGLIKVKLTGKEAKILKAV